MFAERRAGVNPPNVFRGIKKGRLAPALHAAPPFFLDQLIAALCECGFIKAAQRFWAAVRIDTQGGMGHNQEPLIVFWVF